MHSLVSRIVRPRAASRRFLPRPPNPFPPTHVGGSAPPYVLRVILSPPVGGRRIPSCVGQPLAACRSCVGTSNLRPHNAVGAGLRPAPTSLLSFRAQRGIPSCVGQALAGCRSMCQSRPPSCFGVPRQAGAFTAGGATLRPYILLVGEQRCCSRDGRTSRSPSERRGDQPVAPTAFRTRRAGPCVLPHALTEAGAGSRGLSRRWRGRAPPCGAHPRA
jgi:hypothetical protein